MSKDIRILAIDLGTKNIGLAVSDPLGLTAQPLPTLRRSNRRADLAHLGELVEALVASAAKHSPALAKAIESGRKPKVRWLGYDWKLNDKRNKP